MPATRRGPLLFMSLAIGEASTNKTPTPSAAAIIAEQMQALAAAVVERQYRTSRSLDRFGAKGRARCIEDTEYHLSFLMAALDAQSIKQFVDYCAWAKVLLHGRGIDVAHFIGSLRHLQSVLKSKLLKTHFTEVSKYLDAALKALPELPTELPTRIPAQSPFSAEANSYLNALLRFDRQTAVDVVLKASSAGVSVKQIYDNIITPVQHEIGRLWQLGKITVLHEHYCTAATEIVLAELFRQLVQRPPRESRLIALCVEGERHCIALKMLADLLTVEGWQVRYVGADAPTSSAIRFIAQENAHIVAVSVTFAKNLSALQALIDEIRAHPACAGVKVLIGGRATSNDLCKRVGADAYAESIGDAVEIASRLLA